jgi:PEP-CTERM motif
MLIGTRQFALAAVLLTAISCGSRAARADFIDQSNPNPAYPTTVNEFGINLDNSNFGNIGQTFTPTMNSLNYFTFYLQDREPSNATGGSFFVEIVSQNLNTVLGTSATVSLPDSFGIPPAGGSEPLAGAPVMFTFAAPVALSLGTVYEAEIFKASGGSFYAIGSAAGTYAGGSYTSPSPGQSDDLYFIEGNATVPEPSSLALCGIAGSFGLLIARSRRKRIA